MSDFHEQLEAFFQGTASVSELEQAIDQVASDQQETGDVVASLDDAFASGRLPSQIYYSLKNRIVPAAASADDSTIYVPPAEPESDPTIRKAPAESAQAEPVDPTVRSNNQEPAPPPVAEATRLVPKSGTPLPSRSAEITLTLPIDAEYPSQGSKVTGSNWARPEKWTDTNLGPIQPGSVINDRFHIESQLGKGGMGVVFKARDRRKEEAHDTDPFIAIKILNEEFRSHPQALISLQREATKAQTLAHPNIITVYDFDRDGTTVYMTMELMRGQSLSEYIRSFRHGSISPDKAAPIILEMAAGLAYAHEREIVHSDFKPGNVFLTEDNRVKILDFGIARAIQYGGVQKPSKDEFDAGELGAMTPGYASLEMLNGEPPDPSDDVYALAVTAYQLLTGDHPFGRKTAKEALVKKLSPSPIKGLKRREWQTITKGLELRREERIPDAAQFLRKFRGPTRIARSAAATILILLGVASYFVYEYFQEPPPPIPWAQLSATAQANFSEKVANGQAWLDNDPPWTGGAFSEFADAYKIHPRNPLATKGLNAIATAFIERADGAETKTDKRRLLDDIVAVSENEYLAEHKKLRRLKDELTEELNRM